MYLFTCKWRPKVEMVLLPLLQGQVHLYSNNRILQGEKPYYHTLNLPIMANNRITAKDAGIIITSFFLLFGSYLVNLAPPIKDQKLIIGSIQFILVIILLFVVKNQ